MGKSMSAGLSGYEGNTNDWLTPPEIFRCLGDFFLDPCASPNQPWKTARVQYTTRGLDRLWVGRVWLNPPYGPHAWKWVEKLAEHGNGIALVFARTETNWFFKTVWEQADAVFFYKGRINFHYPGTGERSNNSGGGASCLVAYGLNNVDALRQSGLSGVLVPNNRLWEVLNG